MPSNDSANTLPCIGAPLKTCATQLEQNDKDVPVVGCCDIHFLVMRGRQEKGRMSFLGAIHLEAFGHLGMKLKKTSIDLTRCRAVPHPAHQHDLK
jgi:hypothetical protein